MQLSVIVPEAGTERLEQTVNTLFSGMDDNAGEADTATDAAVYIVSALRNSSYDVNQSGEIIEAVLTAENDDADICLIITCYGGPEAGTCASDTAAGAAVLLETARVLSGFSGDTEIHFVFLPGYRYETEHIYTYLTEVFAPDPDRLLGAVVLGGLGLNPAEENVFGCMDARPTFMAEQIDRICQADYGRPSLCTDHSDGVMNALARNLIPSVLYMQKETMEAGTMLDCPALLDYESLRGAADILSRTLALLLSDTTPSMQARAHFTDAAYAEQRKTFSFGENEPLPFGMDLKSLENVTGLAGGRVSENTINNGKELLGYSFSLCWFGEVAPLPSDFYYLSDALQTIRIAAYEEGIDSEDMGSLIDAFYGEEARTSESPYGTACEWTLPMQRLRITLQPQKEGYELNLEEYNTPMTVYPSDSLGWSRMESLFEQVVPEADREHISFQAYTDGYGGTIARLSDDFSDAGSAEWVMGLDLDDMLTPAANFKNKLQATAGLVRMYGEYLAQADPAAYYDAYNIRFGGSIDDFARSFCLFSLCGEPVDEAGPAADPVRYFYDFDELADYRETVRDIR